MDVPCYETGHSLSVLKNVILHEWEMLVREVISSSQHESSIILQDHIPEILDQLEQILKEGKIDEKELGKHHGYYRSTLTRFSVGDLLTEYSLLREVLVVYLYPMGDLGCARLIHKYIDILSKHSTIEFINDQLLHRSLTIEELGDEVREIVENPVISVKPSPSVHP